VVRQAADAGLAAGAWLGELAIRSVHQPQIPAGWHDLLRELMQLRVEVARGSVRGGDRASSDGSAPQTGCRSNELLGAARQVLDQLDALIQQVGRRAVRERQ
jgi:hypothetical protein